MEAADTLTPADAMSDTGPGGLVCMADKGHGKVPALGS